MPEKKALLIRISPELWTELRRLADSEFRSLNGQIEYLLREAVRHRRRGASSQEGLDVSEAIEDDTGST